MYIQGHNEVKRLRTKIYNKQVILMNKINIEKIDDYNNIKIKNLVGEIRLLEEILDFRISDLKQITEEFWS